MSSSTRTIIITRGELNQSSFDDPGELAFDQLFDDDPERAQWASNPRVSPHPVGWAVRFTITEPKTRDAS